MRTINFTKLSWITLLFAFLAMIYLLFGSIGMTKEGLTTAALIMLGGLISLFVSFIFSILSLFRKEKGKLKWVLFVITILLNIFIGIPLLAYTVSPNFKNFVEKRYFDRPRVKGYLGKPGEVKIFPTEIQGNWIQSDSLGYLVIKSDMIKGKIQLADLTDNSYPQEEFELSVQSIKVSEIGEQKKISFSGLYSVCDEEVSIFWWGSDNILKLESYCNVKSDTINHEFDTVLITYVKDSSESSVLDIIVLLMKDFIRLINKE